MTDVQPIDRDEMTALAKEIAIKHGAMSCRIIIQQQSPDEPNAIDSFHYVYDATEKEQGQ